MPKAWFYHNNIKVSFGKQVETYYACHLHRCENDSSLTIYEIISLLNYLQLQ